MFSVCVRRYRTLEPSDIPALAQQGNPDAIELLLDQALQPKGIRPTVLREGELLRIILRGEKPPAPAPLISLIHRGFNQLEIQNLERTILEGRSHDKDTVAWRQVLAFEGGRWVKATDPEDRKRRAIARRKNIGRFLLVGSTLGAILSISWAAASHWIFAPKPTASESGVVTAEEPSDVGEAIPPADRAEPPAPETPNDSQLTLPLPLPEGNSRASAPEPPQSTGARPSGDRLATENPALERSVAATPSVGQPAAERPPSEKPAAQAIPVPPPETTSITIRAVGDIVPGTNYPSNNLHPNPQVFFEGVSTLLAGADILFGNFECTLTNHPVSPKGAGGERIFAFRVPPAYAQLFKAAGFDVLNIANNHSYDFGETGYVDTIASIRQAGMTAVGDVGEVAYTETNGLRVGWIGFTYFDEDNSINDLQETRALVAESERNADITVVTFHGGAEGTDALYISDETEYFYGENRGNSIRFARAAIDSGADLVLGHGPHVPRAMELYKGKLVAYSLGNFIGYQTLNTTAELGYSMVLEVELDESGNFSSGRIHPVRIDGQGIPYVDSEGRSIELVRKLTQAAFPNTSLAIGADGNLIERR